jgi:hypothetical protein
LTFYDLNCLLIHWRRTPPAHLAIDILRRSFLAVNGIEDPRQTGRKQPCFVDESTIRSAVAQFGG